jgi:hypothetical protein
MKSLHQYFLIAITVGLVSLQAQAGKIDPNLPTISYIQYESFDIVSPGQKLTIAGQLRKPVNDGELIPAVVILHGSAGVDSRGALYARALNGRRHSDP